MARWYSIFLSCLLYPFLCQWTVRTTISPSNPTPGCIPRGNHDFRKHRHSNIHSALFTIARTWKQPNCPSAEEWILSSFKRKKQFFYYDKSDTIHICVYTHIEKHTNILWGNSGNSGWLFWGAPKSLQMVIAAVKLKDTYSLEEKLWPT